MIVYEAPERYRGTIEVCETKVETGPDYSDFVIEWRWRCKANNNTMVASGQGYNRKAGALNAIDAQYAVVTRSHAGWLKLTDIVVPWRLLIRDRHGDITTTGAVY
ncbi:hypothetical protein HOV03_gp72 [Gordonia phage Asapag]|uniref:DUF1508 domain-containing protein n=2 Tax=Getalongvirus TaxID=2733156 RepID=A0A410TDW7_9CAUD|nr:hypothetical protein HOS44_gp076 [Gordonia phage BENtherdunthat]YP_009819117.1 hypothetical protein HOV03_gp72 [Gordonia phage Asapag]ATW60846.1 hypothetical protein SEA_BENTHERDUNTHAT_76 [Gordonia phage BENtherdunthat]QAU07212.1 hypothetical protein SEA_ASAPAG_72 [Gordonia phage Asapag]